MLRASQLDYIKPKYKSFMKDFLQVRIAMYVHLYKYTDIGSMF